MAYSPFTRHLNSGILTANRNQQASGATGRTIGGALAAPSVRRALRQGTTLPNTTTSTAAIKALGQGNDLGVVVDSPTTDQGGQGAMESGAAPMGLGSSSSSVESTRGPGRDVSSGVEMSDGAKKAAASIGFGTIKNMATYGNKINPVEAAILSTAQGLPTAALGMVNSVLGDAWSGAEIADAEQAMQATVDSADYAMPSAHSAIVEGMKGVRSAQDLEGKSASQIAGQKLTGRDFDLSPFSLVGDVLGTLGTTVIDALGLSSQEERDRAMVKAANSDVAVDGPTIWGGYNSAAQARQAFDDNRTMHGQLVSSLYDRDTATPGHTVSNASAMAAARDLGKEGLAVSGKGTPSQGPGTGPGNNATGGLAVGGSNAKGGGLSVGVGGSSSNGSNKGDSGGDDSIICSELYRQGLMTKRDRMLGYRHSLRHLSPTTLRGYHVWARPVVRAMKRSQRVTALWRWVWMRRHNEVERVMGKSTKRDLVGMGIRWVTEGFSWVVGACCSLDPVNARFDRKKA